MLFNSFHFLLFFPIVIALYFSLAHKYRWVLLLAASYYFYMSWKAEYIILIMFSTLVDYICGIQIHKAIDTRRKKLFLTLSIVSNIGLLFAFKYFNFFADSTRALLAQFAIPLDPVTLKVLLPVGISFYTFQTLSYTIDVYRGKMEPQRHLGIFAVYVSFFPQLVAGPIERAKNLLPQFFEKHQFEYRRVADGLKLMMWGFFKKVVIADRLALVVDTVYSSPTEYQGLALIVATIFFAFQIYCDFSGYSDIAIGAAQVMGFDLMDNFKRPYFSRSIGEFWRRWHISLSTWFRDYLYIPLGGNRVAKWRWYLNLFIVFVVSGLWHGAAWVFVIWGGLHGLYLIVGVLSQNIRAKWNAAIGLTNYPKLHYAIQMIITFLLVNIGWIFFRADSFPDAIFILQTILTQTSLSASGINLGIGWFELYLSLFLIAFMECIHVMQEHVRMRQFLSNKPKMLRWSIYMIILWMIIFLGVFTEQEFIYFQF